MNPTDPSQTPATSTPAPESPVEATPTTDAQRQAVVGVVRSQIDSLYDNTAAAASTSPLKTVNPYEQTHSQNPQPDLEQWKQYHSAWQTYYQKYYEGYYTHHLKQAVEKTAQPAGYFAAQPALEQLPEDETISKDEALFDLRQKLLSKVASSAKKVRKSRHFVPLTAAILVVLIFAFLQYNRLIIANVMAYVSPGSIDPQNIVVDPNNDVAVGPDPLLIIPKINVDVPVIYDIGNDYNSQMAAMQKGVADFAIPGASSRPGQVGNTVLAGHSSNDLFDQGDYKFIFAQLEKLAVGDTIYVNYQSVRYTYTVTKISVVKPDDVASLVYPTTVPVLTLLTCTPLGTATNRLLVIAQQVSPDPSASKAAPAQSGSAITSIPGESPTLLEKLFGGGG